MKINNMKNQSTVERTYVAQAKVDGWKQFGTPCHLINAPPVASEIVLWPFMSGAGQKKPSVKADLASYIVTVSGWIVVLE